MLPERSSASKNSKSKKGNSGGSSVRHSSLFTPPMPRRRSTRIMPRPTNSNQQHTLFCVMRCGECGSKTVRAAPSSILMQGVNQPLRRKGRAMSVTVCLSTNTTLSYPQGGGHLWVFLNWALGLRALGCEVIWLGTVSDEESAAALQSRHKYSCLGLERGGLVARAS